MKKIIIAGAFVGIFLLGRGPFVQTLEAPIKAVEKRSIDKLNHQQRAWIGALEWCESKGRVSAINPRDRDNTASLGILQFKVTTYALFSELYDFASTTDYMNANQQEDIVAEMIMRGGVDFTKQFPDCVQRLGLPPKN